MNTRLKHKLRPVAPVLAVCAAFAAKPSAYPPEAPKPDVTPVYRRTGNSTEAQRSGFGRKRRCSGMDETCRTCGKRRKKPRRAKSRDFGRCGEKAGQSHGVVRAPRRSHLPAMRAVSGIYEGVPKAAKNSRRALQNEKSPPFQGKQRSSNEIYEVNTEKW